MDPWSEISSWILHWCLDQGGEDVEDPWAYLWPRVHVSYYETTTVGAISVLHRGWGIIIHPIAVIASLARRLVCGLALSYGWRWTWFIFLCGRILWIPSANFFSVGKYGCESIVVAPLSNNSNNKISPLSHKALAVTLPANVCTLNALFLLLSTSPAEHVTCLKICDASK